MLSFSANGGVTCAFLFASGGMADQTARLLGILIIDLELKQIGINRLERFIFIVLLAIAADAKLRGTARNIVLLKATHRLGAMKDPRILQALSLMLLELLTAVPHAMDFGVTVEFVSFSIGALIVMSESLTLSQVL
ncbi:hypothetical protein HWV62_39728 [Athelia sp. TMB]|nr:hypothetical protein HWV62_39728 [Athelia sp. TMB]